MQNDTRIAVDLAKAVFEVAVSVRPGRVARRERLPRSQFLTFLAQHPAATVVMEACASAHYWGRRIEQLGHKVTLLPPHQVRPYVRRNKTDRTDAKGILEASRNDDIRPVPVKTVAQQVLTSLHRLRSGWMGERTARLNALRGLLREMGVFIPVGRPQQGGRGGRQQVGSNRLGGLEPPRGLRKGAQDRLTTHTSNYDAAKERSSHPGLQWQVA